MSSSSGGKFQDHYALLGLDPKADSDAIQKAYTKLAEKFNPKNPETGNAEKFEAVNIAFEVLSDPALRASFDQMKGVNQDDGAPKFSGMEFFEALGRGSVLRTALLCLMYDRRRTKSFTPSLSLRQIENMLDDTNNEELNFALWYLRQRAYVVADDKSNLQISVEGMDFLERNAPSAEEVMTFIKSSALKTPKPATTPTPRNPPAAAPTEGGSWQNLLSRTRA